jgi:hypothetical protein
MSIFPNSKYAYLLLEGYICQPTLATHTFTGISSEEPMQSTVEKELTKVLKADHMFKA